MFRNVDPPVVGQKQGSLPFDGHSLPLSVTKELAMQEHPIVFFDGVCGLCNRAVDWILRHDREGRFRFAPLQGALAKRVLPQAAVSLDTMVLLDGDKRYLRSAAVVQTLLRLGWGWKLLGAALWIIPFPIRDWGYSIVSRYRYWLFGKHEQCRLPKADEKERFID